MPVGKQRRSGARKPSGKKKAAGKAGRPRKTGPAEPAMTFARRDYKALLHRKLTENHLFYEVGRIIASETEPFDLIKKIISVIKREIDFDDASVYTVKRDMTGLEPFFSSGRLFADTALETVYYDSGAPGTIASTGEPLFLQDAALYEGFLHFPDERRKPCRARRAHRAVKGTPPTTSGGGGGFGARTC